MSDYLLDASVVIALLREESADVDLRELVPGNAIGLVNYSEVVDRFAREGHPREPIEAALAPLQLVIVVPDVTLAINAAMWRALTQPYGLSLGDRFCLTLSKELELPLLTTDERLALAAEAFSLPVRHVRQPKQAASQIKLATFRRAP